MKRLAAIFTTLLLPTFLFPARARESAETTIRPVASFYMAEAGSARTADTYLSPLPYRGMGASVAYERLQAMKFCPDRWISGVRLRAGFQKTHNPARNADILGAGLEAGWEMLWKQPLPYGLCIAAGGAPQLSAGALYAARNGNNPVAAKASAMLSATAAVIWNTSCLSRRLTLRWQPTVPLTGCFFSQAYGELYYEIYLGNRSGLAHWAWPGRYTSVDNLLTADIALGATTLRLGYHGSFTSTRVSHITTRLAAHAFVVGIGGEWMSVNRYKAPSADARIISSIY